MKLFWIPCFKKTPLTSYSWNIFRGKRTPTCPLCLNGAGSSGSGWAFGPGYGHAHLCTHAPPPRAGLRDGCSFPSRAALIGLFRHIWRVPPPLQTSIHFDSTIQTPIRLLDLITGPSSVAFACWMLLCVCLRIWKTIPNSNQHYEYYNIRKYSHIIW